jgi:septum formation protein
MIPDLSQPRLRVVLASASPRRAALLRQVGIPFIVAATDAEDAAPFLHATPGAFVEGAAMAKARAAAAQVAHGLVIGADTVVVHEGQALGKPADPQAAAAMLRRLSGRTHEVFTGVALVRSDGGAQPAALVSHERTRVTFRDLSDEDVACYVATGEPLDKAGAYGIQERGALLVSAIEGCYTNVVGLPIARLVAMLRQMRLSPWRLVEE